MDLDVVLYSHFTRLESIDPFHDDVARLWGGIKPRLLMFQLKSVNRKPIRGMPKIFEKG